MCKCVEVGRVMCQCVRVWKVMCQLLAIAYSSCIQGCGIFRFILLHPTIIT